MPSCVCKHINDVIPLLITLFSIPSVDRRVLATGQGYYTNKRAERLQNVTAHDADAADRGMINSTHPVNN